MRGLDEIRADINECDAQLRRAFMRRMGLAREVAEYKRQNSLPVFDAAREREVIERNAGELKDSELIPYYRDFLKSNMAISRRYQKKLLSDSSAIYADIGEDGYYVHVGNGLLEGIDALFDLERRVFIVTDSGIPEKYVRLAAAKCKAATVHVVPSGEASKCFAVLEGILIAMQKAGLTRSDCVLALGGGVVGDLAAFAAASYMRGIDLYSVPTTLLAMLDSSVGGKCGIDLCGIKNSVGTFYQPKGVVIDPTRLSTLDKRQTASGLAEAIKMAATCDAQLFALIEDGLFEKDAAELIRRALAIKIAIVEEDEREGGLRRVLNFGHTLGHAIEAELGLLHGECVALGMLPMASDEARARLVPLLVRYGLPTAHAPLTDAKRLLAADKKAEGECVLAVYVDRIGEYRVTPTGRDELSRLLE